MAGGDQAHSDRGCGLRIKKAVKWEEVFTLLLILQIFTNVLPLSALRRCGAASHLE